MLRTPEPGFTISPSELSGGSELLFFCMIFLPGSPFPSAAQRERDTGAELVRKQVGWVERREGLAPGGLSQQASRQGGPQSSQAWGGDGAGMLLPPRPRPEPCLLHPGGGSRGR